MESASRLTLAWMRFVLASIVLASAAHAQELWPGMESYLKLTLVPVAGSNAPEVAVTNLYSAGLVEISWTYSKCADGPHFRHSGHQDLADTLGNPTVQGETVQTPSARGCSGGITAAIFADGKELGDPDALRQIHDCRRAKREEVHRTLEDDIFKFPLSGWDPESSVKKLKDRRAQFPMNLYTDDPNVGALQACRTSTLEYLASAIEDYRTSVARNPSKFEPRRAMFLQYLKEMEQALESPIYPSSRTWWKGP
jgi:hypothetical protein